MEPYGAMANVGIGAIMGGLGAAGVNIPGVGGKGATPTSAPSSLARDITSTAKSGDAVLYSGQGNRGFVNNYNPKEVGGSTLSLGSDTSKWAMIGLGILALVLILKA